ncbi:MAG: RodZ domain-containing protein [Pseudomonadota bacterium]
MAATDAQKSYDDFEITLGDVMRGERATMGKSLMDVQRELKIKAAYVAAVEDADPSVFDTPGFIAGYVRSYAKYLDLDPEWAFDKFCMESGFATVHGMSERALPARMSREDRLAVAAAARPDPLQASATPFVPPKEPLLSQLNVKAIGSSLVLLLLVGGLGFGAYRVVQEVQQVQMAPIDQPPMAQTDLDPLAPRQSVPNAQRETVASVGDTADPVTPEARINPRVTLAELYEPTPDIPTLTEPRDGPISRIDPNQQGAFVAPSLPQAGGPSIATMADAGPIHGPFGRPPLVGPSSLGDATLQLASADTAPVQELAIFSTTGAWMRIRDAQGAIVYSQTMEPGQRFVIPTDLDEPYQIERVGMSGFVFFQVNGSVYGPIGSGTRLVKDVELTESAVKDRFLEVLEADRSDAVNDALEQLGSVVAAQ